MKRKEMEAAIWKPIFFIGGLSLSIIGIVEESWLRMVGGFLFIILALLIES